MFYKLQISILLIFLTSTAFAEKNPYQEEYIFLKNQLESLKKRKAQTTKQLQGMEEGLKTKINRLNGQVASLEAGSEVLKTQLSAFDENRTDTERNFKKVEVVTDQMKSFALKTGQELESLEDLNAAVLGYLKQGAGETSTKGFAFNKKGIKEEGEVYALGHIASYFVKGDKYIPLATNASKTGLMFTEQSVPKGNILNLSDELRTLPVSLKDGEIVKEKTLGVILREKLDAGGAVGYVILFLGLLGIGVALIRYNLIKSYQGFNEKDVRTLVGHIQNGNIEYAKEALGTQRSSSINQFVELLISCRHKTDEVYETIVVGEISKVQSKLSKYGPYLLVLAAVAPLLGLLGTVTGMIGTFDMITIHGTGNPKILSGGIKEALVTTQMGLIVAIPCILAGNYLSSQASKIVNKFEEVASSIPKV